MNHKLSALALTGVLALTLSACSGGATPSQTPAPTLTPPAITETVSPTATPESPIPTESLLPITPSPTVAPTQAPSQAPSDKPATQPTQKPATPTPKPTAVPTPAPTELPVPTQTPEPELSSKIQAVWDEIAKLELPALTDVNADTLSSLYGISSSDLVEYICKITPMNVQATEFFLAQVKPGSMDRVKSALEQRQAALDEQWSTYLPAQHELVKNYQLVTNGDYVLFAISDYASDAVTAFHTYTK